MEELINKAKQGDSNAISEIASNYNVLIRGIVNKFFLFGGDKDDVMQEAMIGLFYAINNFDESKGNFTAFVKLCVESQVISAVKKDLSDKNKPLKNYVELSNIEQLTDYSDSPLDELIEKERFEKVLKVVETNLTKTEKRVLELFAEGYSYEDIATDIGKSYKAVDGALQRARKKLIEALKEKK